MQQKKHKETRSWGTQGSLGDQLPTSAGWNTVGWKKGLSKLQACPSTSQGQRGLQNGMRELGVTEKFCVTMVTASRVLQLLSKLAVWV